MTFTDIDMLVLISGKKAVLWGNSSGNGHLNGEIITDVLEEKLNGNNGKNGNGQEPSGEKPGEKPVIPAELLTCCDNKALLPYRGARAKGNNQELMFCGNCGQIWAVKSLPDNPQETYLVPIVQ